MSIYNHYTIYKITNLVNNKVYIGQTIHSYLTRWIQHKSYSKKGNQILYKSIRKYGFENFIIEPICSCFDIDELNLKETFFILFYRSNEREFGYNCDTGGNGKIITDIYRNNMCKAAQDRTKIKKICEICNKIVDRTNYSRWHGNNCGKNRTWKEQFGDAKAKDIIEKRRDYSGKNNPMYGKSRQDLSERNKKGLSKESIEKMITTKQLKEKLRKENGLPHPNSDINIYTFSHPIHGIKICSKRELLNFINDSTLNMRGINNIVSSRRKSHRGWIILNS